MKNELLQNTYNYNRSIMANMLHDHLNRQKVGMDFDLVSLTNFRKIPCLGLRMKNLWA